MMEPDETQDTSTQAEEHFLDALDALGAGRPQDAVVCFKQALALKPYHSEAMHGLIRALEQSDQLDEALTTVQQLITDAPDDVLAHTSLSIIYQRMGKIPEAEAASARAKILDWKRQLHSPDEGTINL